MRDKRAERAARERKIARVRAGVRSGTAEGPPVPPAAPRNSYWQEAILEALADGEWAQAADIRQRIAPALGLGEPTQAHRANRATAIMAMDYVMGTLWNSVPESQSVPLVLQHWKGCT